MNRKRSAIKAIFVGLSFLMFSGCLEYKVVTQIMEDGSIRRTVTVRGDSSLIFEQSVPLYDDPGWEIQTRYEPQDGQDPDGDEVFVLEATRTFPDVNSLNEVIYTEPSHSDRLNIKAAFQKQFRWFYQLYQYSETYIMRFPFRSQSIHDFMTSSELRVYYAEDDQIVYDPEKDSLGLVSDDMILPILTHEDSLRVHELKDQLDVKYEEWAKRNLFDAFYSELETAFETLSFVPGPGNLKEDLYQWLDSNKVFEEIFDEQNVLLAEVAGFYRLDSANLHTANRVGFDEFNRKTKELEFNLDSFNHQVLMPGMVLQSNAGETDGNLVSWNFTTNDFYASDYTMTVQSRVINRWMIVVSAGIVLLVVGILIYSLIVKRR
jgi:hypothetical protein